MAVSERRAGCVGPPPDRMLPHFTRQDVFLVWTEAAVWLRRRRSLRSSPGSGGTGSDLSPPSELRRGLSINTAHIFSTSCFTKSRLSICDCLQNWKFLPINVKTFPITVFPPQKPETLYKKQNKKNVRAPAPHSSLQSVFNFIYIYIYIYTNIYE